MKCVDDYWKNIRPIDTHVKEYQMVNILNNHFIQTHSPFTCERVTREGCENIYSEYDADIFEFDWETLSKGNIVSKIDFERKPKDVFIQGKPPSYWKNVNFLTRKVSKQTNRDNDLYVLHDNHDTDPQIIWATYGVIRSFGIKHNDINPENRWYSITPRNYNKLGYGYNTLSQHLLFPSPQRTLFN